MFTVIISIAAGLVVMLALALTGVSAWGWAIFFGFLGFFASQFISGSILKKKIQQEMQAVQAILLSGQKQMQEKTNTWRFRPPGSPKQAQIELAKMQHVFIEKALKQSESFERYYKWSPLLKRQIATFRMQMNYQDRNYDEVDRLMPSCLFMEPISMAMKMARMYSRNDDKIDAFFEKSVRRMRYGQGAVLYGLYAWICVKRGNIDKAITILQRSDKHMENETLKHALEVLKNNRPKQFSLAGLGDEWYALGLEEPRIKFQRAPQRPF